MTTGGRHYAQVTVGNYGRLLVAYLTTAHDAYALNAYEIVRQMFRFFAIRARSASA